MSDGLDQIATDLRAMLSKELIAEMDARIAWATRLAAEETILRLSFKLSDGGAKIRERVFEVTSARS